MAEQCVQRRLAAILDVDVAGYSGLIRFDEEVTLGRLKSVRADLIDPKIAEHHGRIVKLMGDGMLAKLLISNLTVLPRAKICFESGAKCEEASPTIGKSRLSHKLDSVPLV